MRKNDAGQWVLEGGVNEDGTPTWGKIYPFGVVIEGEDLVARGVRMTWFAGGRDSQDNNRGAYGDSTLDPDLVGVSLPSPNEEACRNPPMPGFNAQQAHKVTVRVYSAQTNKSVDARLVDIGPAAPPKARAGIDGTIGLWRALGLNYRNGSTTVSFRVIDGAKYLPETVRQYAGLE